MPLILSGSAGLSGNVGTTTKEMLPAGTVLQVVTGRSSEYFTSSSADWVDITGLAATITPLSSSSKILIALNFGKLGINQYNLDYIAAMRVLRNGSDNVAINGDVAGDRQRICMLVNGYAYNSDHGVGGLGCQALDAPASSLALTYKVQIRCQEAARYFTMNRSVANGNSGSIWHAASQSSITLKEIKG